MCLLFDYSLKLNDRAAKDLSSGMDNIESITIIEDDVEQDARSGKARLPLMNTDRDDRHSLDSVAPSVEK